MVVKSCASSVIVGTKEILCGEGGPRGVISCGGNDLTVIFWNRDD